MEIHFANKRWQPQQTHYCKIWPGYFDDVMHHQYIGLFAHRSSAHEAGVGTIFDRVLTELVAKMREMKMDKTELASLKAIVLFNPGMYDKLLLLELVLDQYGI